MTDYSMPGITERAITQFVAATVLPEDVAKLREFIASCCEAEYRRGRIDERESPERPFDYIRKEIGR